MKRWIFICARNSSINYRNHCSGSGMRDRSKKNSRREYSALISRPDGKVPFRDSFAFGALIFVLWHRCWSRRISFSMSKIHQSSSDKFWRSNGQSMGCKRSLHRMFHRRKLSRLGTVQSTNWSINWRTARTVIHSRCSKVRRDWNAQSFNQLDLVIWNYTQRWILRN